MNRGTAVVRVSLRSDEGELNEHGRIEKTFECDGKIIGYAVVWEKKPACATYVAPVRIQSLEAWEAERRTRPIEATA
jgi:hypothetical protein